MILQNTDWLGVVVGSIVSILTTLAFNRYSEFKKTKEMLSYDILNLSKLADRIDYEVRDLNDIWRQVDYLIRDRLNLYYFSFKIQNQKDACAFVQSVINEINQGCFLIIKEVSNTEISNLDLDAYPDGKMTIAKIKIEFQFGDLSRKHTDASLRLVPDPLMIAIGQALATKQEQGNQSII